MSKLVVVAIVSFALPAVAIIVKVATVTIHTHSALTLPVKSVWGFLARLLEQVPAVLCASALVFECGVTLVLVHAFVAVCISTLALAQLVVRFLVLAIPYALRALTWLLA